MNRATSMEPLCILDNTQHLEQSKASLWDRKEHHEFFKQNNQKPAITFGWVKVASFSTEMRRTQYLLSSTSQHWVMGSPYFTSCLLARLENEQISCLWTNCCPNGNLRWNSHVLGCQGWYVHYISGRQFMDWTKVGRFIGCACWRQE